MDQVVQQNASSSEELAATAEELAAQATKLVEAIEFFKTEEARSDGRAARRKSEAQSAQPPEKLGITVKREARALAAPAKGAAPREAKPTAIAPARDAGDSEFEEF